MKKLAIALIRFYKAVIVPYHPYRCRFYPSCSDYALEAIEKKGLLRGLFLSILRLIRCNPISRGGYDPLR